MWSSWHECRNGFYEKSIFSNSSRQVNQVKLAVALYFHRKFGQKPLSFLNIFYTKAPHKYSQCLNLFRCVYLFAYLTSQQLYLIKGEMIIWALISINHKKNYCYYLFINNSCFMINQVVVLDVVDWTELSNEKCQVD